MRKIMLVGKSGSGKTTLINHMEGVDMPQTKTQSIEVHNKFIDTPGEYLEHRYMYNALFVSAAQADIIALVEDPSSERMWMPPGFRFAFDKDVIGIITKIDIANNDMIQASLDRLSLAGAKEIFKVSAFTNIGIEELGKYINNN